MTLQEILRAKGMSDEDIQAVVGEMKTNGIYTTKHENMDVRYPKLKGDFDDLTTQHNALVANAPNAEALQGQIVAHEATIANLTAQLNEQKIEAAMDRSLNASGAKAEDFDYLKFQWRKKGDITLDDNGEIKGATEAINGLKTQCPAQFAGAQKREIEPHKLQDGNDGGTTVTKEQFDKMGYSDRVKLRESNPEAYAQYTKG